jgi:hypothetical protein
VGSTFAGVKAGVLAGVVYFGVLAFVNVLVLFTFQKDAIAVITANYPQSCSAPSNSSAYDCLVNVAQIQVPFVAFLGFFLSLVLAGVFGRLYEHVPGKDYKTKGISMGLLLLVVLTLVGLVGYTFDAAAAYITGAVEVVAAVGYGLLLGFLYARYTRRVEFVSAPGAPIRIVVDGKDFTGKARTFSSKSVHEIRAATSEESSFKEWVVSGGVTVEDDRSYETTMEVNGDGMLKAVSRKA